MPAATTDILADRIEVEATIDGYEFLDWTEMKYTAEANRARSLTFAVAGREALERCRLGARTVIECGRGNQQHNLSFEGVIKNIRPGPVISHVTALDLITHLHKSELVDYKLKNIQGQDLYFLAKDAAGYKGINTTNLTEGSGLIATADMGLTGLQTRGEFINKCFSYMYRAYDDADHENLSYVPWRYGIRSGRRLDFWLSDNLHKRARPVITLSEADDNLTGEGIVAEIDASRMINSSTFFSSDDETIYSTFTDENSVELFGPYSNKTSFDSTNKSRLMEMARDEVQRSKGPTLAYTLQLHNGEWLALGDLVQIVVPQVERDIILPVVRYETSVGEEIITSLTVGEPPLSLSEYITRLG